MTPEQFCRLADCFAEPALLLNKGGVILAANRAAGDLGHVPAGLAGRTLDQLAASSAEAVRDYLRLCSRSRDLVPGSLDLIAENGRVISCRCHGAVVEHDADRKESLLLLRLQPKETAQSRFDVLTLKISELNEEIRRRRLAEERLREQREWLSVTLTSIGDAVITTDDAARVTFLNPVAEALTGWSEADARGRPLEEVFHILNEYTRHPVENPARKVLSEGAIVGLANHTVLIAKDGAERPIDDSGAPIRNAEGRIAGVVLVFRDVTERKRTEESLRTSEERFRSLVEQAPFSVQVFSADGRIVQVNRAWEELWGVTLDRIPEYNVLEDPQLDARGVLPLIRRAFEGQPVPIPAIKYDPEESIPGRTRNNESIRWVASVAYPLKDEAGEVREVVLVHEDMTARIQAEQALRESEEQFRTAFELAAVGNVQVDAATGRLIRANRKYCEMIGRTPEELEELTVLDLTHPEDRESDWQILSRMMRGETDTYFNEKRLVRKDGEPVWVGISASLIRGANGAPLRTIAVVQDRTEWRKADEELRHQRLLLQTITDNATSMLLMMDTEGRGTFVNPAVERITGFRADELIGEVLHEKIHHTRPDGTHYPVEECPLDNALPLRESVQGHEDVFVRKDGTFFPVRCSARPVLRDGEPVATVIEVQNITEEKRVADALLERDERFRAIADHSVTGIAEVDLTGRMTFINDRYCAMVGRSGEELLGGMRMQDVTHPDDLAANLPLFERLVREGKPFVIEKRYVRPDGSPVWVNNSVSGVRGTDGRLKSVVAVSVDVTDRRRAEDELRAANRSKDEFLAMLAHELRNPLAPIRSGLDLLGLMGTDGQIIEPMQQHVEHLVRLVDDLLDVSRIMRGKVELRRESVDLSSIVDRAVRTSRPLIDAHRHELSLELPPEQVTLDADPVRLSQVIANLLNNAAKYTEDGGRILLSARTEDGEAVVTVSDTGIGIEPDLLPRIFDLFTQAERGIDRSEGGLGIGLTLVKNLVELHGGSVMARSKGLGQGSTFAVRLPLGQATVPQERKVERSDSTGAYRLLLVDDNVAAAKMLSMLVQKLGRYEVFLAHDGPSALEAAKSHRPDIILLDIGLPRMDGYEVARQLRQQHEFERTLVIALTGYGTEEDRRKSLHAGCDDHLVKPPSIDDLKHVLAHPKLPSK